jgi:hypothetical protein
MVGVSGTSKGGNLHYYYACQKKRLEKSCDKRTVRRDWIELNVAAAIKEYILQDYVIEWMADCVMEYSKRFREESDITLLESNLAEVQKSKKNILKAIEQGVFNSTTNERMLELEAEERDIQDMLLIERAATREVTREDVLSSFEAYRSGKIEDKNYQTELFDTFLTAVYLYDDDMEIMFEFTGKRNTVKIPFKSKSPPPGNDELEDDSVRISTLNSHHRGPINIEFIGLLHCPEHWRKKRYFAPFQLIFQTTKTA